MNDTRRKSTFHWAGLGSVLLSLLRASPLLVNMNGRRHENGPLQKTLPDFISHGRLPPLMFYIACNLDLSHWAVGFCLLVRFSFVSFLPVCRAVIRICLSRERPYLWEKASSFLVRTHLLLRGPRITIDLKIESWIVPLVFNFYCYLWNQKTVLDGISDVLLPFLLRESLLNSERKPFPSEGRLWQIATTQHLW